MTVDCVEAPVKLRVDTRVVVNERQRGAAFVGWIERVIPPCSPTVAPVYVVRREFPIRVAGVLREVYWARDDELKPVAAFVVDAATLADWDARR